MTRQEAFDEINAIQNMYVDKLISLIDNDDYAAIKNIYFTSPTGTGKTKMMSKLINKMGSYYFIVTTLSKGQLHLQISKSLQEDCIQDNYFVYGSLDYRINSKLDAETIIARIPQGKKCIWLRDEGHIKTNRFDALLQSVCYKVVNFSATNAYSDIQCDFTQTMMLRTVNQMPGSPEDAIKKLVEVKQKHKDVLGYNPCAIFRCVSGDDDLYNTIINLCEKYHLTYIDISNEPFVMEYLCEDNNENDVIINKFKLIEGIDIRRAHVLYMDNQPSNNATTIQAIGRCRRNALLYRDDIDIFSAKNKELLENTRECYVYYNVETMKIDSDVNGELYYAFCDEISCEALKTGMTIEVENGKLPNGLKVMELRGLTGRFEILTDPGTGFNIVSPITEFYDTVEQKFNEYLYVNHYGFEQKPSYIDKRFGLPATSYKKIRTNDVSKMHLRHKKDSSYYMISEYDDISDYKVLQPDFTTNIAYFDKKAKKYTKTFLEKALCLTRIETILGMNSQQKHTSDYYANALATYKSEHNDLYTMRFYQETLNLDKYIVENVDGMSCDKLLIRDIMCNESQIYLSFCCLQRFISESKSMLSITDEKMNDIIFRNIERMIKEVIKLVLVVGINKDDSENINKIILCYFKRIIERNIYFNEASFFNIYFNEASLLAGMETLAYPTLRIECTFGHNISVSKAAIDRYFKCLDMFLEHPEFTTKNISLDTIVNVILQQIQATRNKLSSNIVERVRMDYTSLFQVVSSEEIKQLNEGNLRLTNTITKTLLEKLQSYKHDKIINDKESAVVGVDIMKPIKANNKMIWIESCSVSSKIGNYNKLNAFISKKYSSELTDGKSQCFNGKNNFKLDKKCNSALGYCVEYYSKYLVYGESYLEGFIEIALREAKSDKLNESLIVRACMLKYKEMMARSFGQNVSKILKTMSVTTLTQEKYRYFVELVVTLGSQTAEYVKQELYSNQTALDDTDPDLSIRHISGLADYITKDTILDVKVLNHIDEKCIRQVLAYHYLSTKRSDLKISKVIVYDAVSNKAVKINITSENMKGMYD